MTSAGPPDGNFRFRFRLLRSVYGISRLGEISRTQNRDRSGPLRTVADIATVAAVVGVELRRWRRERLAVASALVLPVAMAALVTAALGGEVPDVRFTFAVVDRAHDTASAAFVDEALGHPTLAGVVVTRPVASERAARRLLDEGDVDAVVVLPHGLAARLTGIEIAAEHPMADGLATMVVDRYLAEARATALAVARTGRAPAGPWPLRVEPSGPGGQRLDAVRHYGPGIGMFFVLVGMGFAAQRLVADRRRGLVDRVATTPASPGAAVVGRAVAALAVGGLSLGTTAATSQLVFGRAWGPPLAVAALATATIVALAGVAAVLATLSRTPEQAALAGTAVAFVFALASGSFSPPGAAATRPALADLVPTAHALDAFASLATEPSVTVASVATPIAVLCAFGLVGGVAAVVLAGALAGRSAS